MTPISISYMNKVHHHTRDRDANSSRQNDVTWCDFFAGETSRALALSLAFAAENIKNLPLALLARKKLSVRLVGKSKRGCLFEEIKERGKFDRSRDMVSGSWQKQNNMADIMIWTLSQTVQYFDLLLHCSFLPCHPNILLFLVLHGSLSH